MGKGKKKEKKGENAPDGQPDKASTSQAAEVGLTGGGGTSKEDTPPAVKQVESTKPPAEPEEDDGGLGLTGSGKSRSRKKPAKKAALSVSQALEQLSISDQSVPRSVVSPGSEAPPPGLVPGAGRGKGRGRGRGADFPPVGPSGPGSPPGGPSGPGFPPVGPSGPGFPPVGPSGPGFPPVGPSGDPAAGFPTPQVSPGLTPGLPRPGPPPGLPTPAPPGPAFARQQAYPIVPTSGPSQPGRSGPGFQTAPASKPEPAQTTVALKSTMSGLTIPRKVFPPSNRRVGVPYKDIKVLTNYLQMMLTPKTVYRYDVSFNPAKPKKMIPAAFINMVKAHKMPKEVMAFDQVKNCYSLTTLPNVPKDGRFCTNVEVIDNNGKKVGFEITMKLTGVVETQKILDYMKNKGSSLNPPSEAIACIDVVLRQGSLENYVKIGRQFFRRPQNPIDLTGGLEMWTGLFQSAIFTSSAFINIDIAHKGFPREQPLVQALTNDFRLNTNMPVERQRSREVEQFQDFIKNLRVIATIGGDATAKGQKREFICNSLVDAPTNIKFKSTDASGKTKNMTVADYFKEKGVRLAYPNLNCVWVGPRDKTIYYPMELLKVAYGQRSNKLLNERQLSTMVKTAAAPPNERKQKIDEVKQAMNYSRNDYFKKFGLNISNEFFEVGARILKPPTLDVGNRQSMMPRDGVWNANGLLKPEALQSWGFVALDCDQRNHIDHDGMIRMIISTGRQMGMEVNNPSPCLPTASLKELSGILFRCLEQGVKFLFIIVGTWGRDCYQRVKQMAELDVGILTQCVKENTVARRMNIQTVKNILLKVNSKLMGINQALNSASRPLCLQGGGVMVVGADVTHPSPDQPNVPSIAAVTASMDHDCYKYNIELSVQTPKKEMIVDFEEMMLDHLKIYKEKMQHLPKKIFYFRDGVSEGQFAQVMDSEIPAMHRAYQRLSGGPKPEILFLLVQKRHHTRFFSGARDCRNVDPGTVVDEHIVHASELDFYLVSHKAIKGTARPTRYHAVCNDGNIPYDEVEQLTYYLCHLYARCMRAVSYPTPTYYAHLACLRAKALTYGKQFNNNDLERTPVRLRVLDKMLQYSRMFFI